MFRGLILAAVAVGVALFGASLLRSEKLAVGDEPEPDGSCTAKTRSGGSCSRPAEPGSDRCWQHS